MLQANKTNINLNKFQYFGKVVDAFLNAETGLLEGIKIQSGSLPARIYYVSLEDLNLKKINFETFFSILKQPKDISPGIFEHFYLNKKILPLTNIDIYDFNLSFLGNLENIVIKIQEKIIFKASTTFGHEIELKSLYVDSFKEKKSLVINSRNISFCDKNYEKLFGTRVLYENSLDLV